MKFEQVLPEFMAYPGKQTVLPTRSTAGSAGYDFRIKEDLTLEPGEIGRQYFDVRCKMAPGEVLLLVVRSSVGINLNLALTNGTGVIDSDYYNNPTTGGNISFSIRNDSGQTVHLEAGDRLLQGIVVNYVVSEDDNVTAVRTGETGSTGR